ncbi:chemotaxis protein [Kitasatospora sp. NPDC056138]|uniref:baeRF3 domain-containing protein n=1 Tax=Kitasatospora sp. NPDC056138 TaxID=3345724 RepID=UPI0035D9F54C
MHPDLTPATLAELRRPRRYPAVSVLMPTHRREPENTQDPVRLRNLLAEARQLLQADPDVSRADRIDVEGQLDAALTEIDLVHAEDALAVFAAPGEHQVWSLGRTVPARVVLSDTFLTRNLVATQAAEQPRLVLALAADRVSLWQVGPEHATELTGDTFPLTRSLEDPDAERQERIGDVPSTFRDEQTRQFLREADTAAGAVLAADTRPLYLVGEAPALALLDEVGTVTRRAVARIALGGLAHGPAEQLWRAVQPAIAAQEEQEVTDALAELDRSRGQHEFAAGVDEVWQNVTAKRAGLLVVEEDYRTTVRDDGDHLVPAERGDPGAREDIVDEIVEQALETGARVRFVPAGRLTDMGGIAAVLRY